MEKTAELTVMGKINRYILPVLITTLLLASGLLVGCEATKAGNKAEKTTPTSKSTSDWGGHWNEALRLHRAGQFYSALLEFDRALALMPTDDSMLAIRAGTIINKGECHLMLFQGLQAHTCSQEASDLLEQASQYEKMGVAWNIMASQSLLIGTASLIYVPDNKGNYPYGEAKRLLEKIMEMTKMPEAYYFLGIVNDNLGNKQQAKSQFEAFLSSPDVLVTFTSKDAMRQRAKDWLGKP